MTPEAMLEYATDGIAYLPGAVPKGDLHVIQRLIARIVMQRRARFLRKDASLDYLDTLEFDRAVLELNARSSKHRSFIYDIAKTLPEVHRLVTAPWIIRVAQRAFGTDKDTPVGISDLQLRIDGPPEAWDETLPWHQDYPYIPLVTPACTVVIWIPIWDCSEEMGPPEFVPGSHKWGPLEVREVPSANSRRMIQTIPLDRVRECEAMSSVCRPVKAGDAVAFDICTVHRSGTNRAKDRIRWSITCRYNNVFAPHYLPKYLP
jgi:hypothetical protein